jgi:hypothetical protein
MQKVKDFWINSYKSDKIAFGFELVSFVFTVIASLTLAFNAIDPNMLVIYPFFFVGSVTQCYAAVRRGAAWVMLLTGYFAVINVVGYGVAALIWFFVYHHSAATPYPTTLITAKYPVSNITHAAPLRTAA